MNTKTKIPYLLMLFLCLAQAHTGYAQPCSVTSVPAYKSCFTEYFTAISASGDMGTTSSISVSASSCTGTYFNLYSTQGIDAPIGANVTLNFSRFTTQYTGYVSVYIDWDGNGQYAANEYAGWSTSITSLHDVQMDPTVMSDTCNITLDCGISTPGTYRMRVMLSERRNNEGAPCDSGDYGQGYDFYYNAYCTTAPILGDSVLCSNDTAILIPPGRCGFWSSSDYAKG